MNFRTRIKFCGMTSVLDALEATQLGVDAIGLIFHPASTRNVTVDCAKSIASSLPPFVTRVGVVANERRDVIHTILNQVPLDLLQFHGQESAEFCRSFNKPYIKVIQVAEAFLKNDFEQQYPDAAGFLFDTKREDTYGGSGQTFNWHLLPAIHKPLILAGGLTLENVSEAIVTLKPYAIDVVTGIEKTKGKKDFIKMQQFVQAVYATNRGMDER